MPRIAMFNNVTATLATTAPVLAMVAGLATAQLIASATGIATQDGASEDHPRRGARTVVMVAPGTAHHPALYETQRRGARAADTDGGDVVAEARTDAAQATDPARARVISRQ